MNKKFNIADILFWVILITANDCIYITKKINKNFFSNFEITEFGRYIVAIPKQ